MTLSKRTLIIGGSLVAILIVLFFTVFTIIANQYKPIKTVEAFNEAVENNDIETLKQLMKPNEKDAEMNKEALSAFSKYLQANNESYQVIKNGFEKQIEDDDFKSSNLQVSLIKDGKKMGIFPNYKMKVNTVHLKVKGNEDRDKVSLAIVDSDDSINQADEEEAIYGPIIPGEYNIEAKVTNDLGKFTNEEKIDAWGDADVSFVVDSEKMARQDKAIQKSLIDAGNQFNEDMSVYVTSNFEADKFTNISDELKDNLFFYDAGLEIPEDYVEKIESQFLKAIVNMDEIDLTYFDGEWNAEVTMLVFYDEKITFTENKEVEDLSYVELRDFSFIFDQDKKQWIIEDVMGENMDESEVDDWENKEEIKIKDPPLRKWTKDDSYL